MSRGLGRLQRFIKEQIYSAEREYKREMVALNGRRKVDPDIENHDNGVKTFSVYWWDVRHWVEENPDFNPGPYRLSESLERSTKRALHTLVKRGGCQFPLRSFQPIYDQRDEGVSYRDRQRNHGGICPHGSRKWQTGNGRGNRSGKPH
jgi:hypothetical protein